MRRAPVGTVWPAIVLLSAWLGAPPAEVAGQAPQMSRLEVSGLESLGQRSAGDLAASLDGILAARLGANGITTTAPDVSAAAAAVYSPATGEMLWGENVHAQRSIASITKLMTAAVFVEDFPDLTRTTTVTYADVRRASTTYLRRNDRIRTGELLHLLLIGSDNAAARVLARVSPWGESAFIERMNRKAEELGLERTRFTDPSGLDAGNVSSASELSRLLIYASDNQALAPIMQTPRYSLAIGRRRLTVRNTNRLLDSDLNIQAGKTGFIREAGYCLATLLRLPQGPQVAVVILGARSNLGRFREARRIIDWVSTRAEELLSEAPLPQ